jgi:hypothetical protein
MPQFYFHIREQDSFIPDEEGLMLRDLKEARQEALDSCFDLVRERMDRHHRVNGLRIDIADASGTIIDSVNLRDGSH